MTSDVCIKDNQSLLIVHSGNLPSSIDNSRVCEVSKAILLYQEPREPVTVNFSLFVTENHNSRNGYTTTILDYNFTLIFENNLHFVSNDYGYEIEFFVCAYENDSLEHSLLFSTRKMRDTNKISISNHLNNDSDPPHPDIIEKLLMDSYEKHLCCSIRRFNVRIGADQQPQMDLGFESRINSDVTLVVGKELFKVHKHVLSGASDIFKAMFSHNMRENQNDKVIIKDFHPAVVEGLLSFLYTGKTLLLSEMPIELFQIADKYEVQPLITLCLENFLFIVNNENVFDLLYNANMYELTDLKARLLKFIHVDEEEMVKKENFQTFLFMNLQIDTVVYTLKLCDKYRPLLRHVERETFKFIQNNNSILIKNGEFLELFHTHSSLMQRLYVFLYKKD